MSAFGRVWELIKLQAWQRDFRTTCANAEVVFGELIWWVEYQPLRLSFAVEVEGAIQSEVCFLSRAGRKTLWPFLADCFAEAAWKA